MIFFYFTILIQFDLLPYRITFMEIMDARAVAYFQSRELGITVYSARIMISVKSAGLEIDVQVRKFE